MNDKKGMFLAIAAVLAMIIAGAAVVMASGEDVDAAATPLSGNISGALSDASGYEIVAGATATVNGATTLSSTLTVKGTLSLDVTSTYNFTIAAGGKIVVENGGRIVGQLANGLIVVSATSGDVIDVKSGGVLGYAAYENAKLNNSSKAVGITTANLSTFDNAITTQDVTGPFTISAAAGPLLTIKGDVNAFTTKDAGDSAKYLVPRMCLYGDVSTDTPQYTPAKALVATNDLTIGTGVYSITYGLKVADGKTLTVNGALQNMDAANALIIGSGSSVIVNGVFSGSATIGANEVYSQSLTKSSAGNSTFADIKSYTGFTLANASEALQISGSLILPEGSTDNLTVTLIANTAIPAGKTLTVTTGAALNTDIYTIDGAVLLGTSANKMTVKDYIGTIAGTGAVISVNNAAAAEISINKGTVASGFVNTAGIKAALVTVDEGATLAITTSEYHAITKLVALGTVTGTEASITTLEIGPNANVAATITVSGGSSEARDYVSSDYQIQGELQSSISITNASLSNDTVIPEGMYLEVKENLLLNGKKLTVNGELRIAAGATISSTDKTDVANGKNTIVLSSTGSIVNSGIIGKNFAVGVKSDAGTAVFKTLKGVQFDTVKVGDNYTLVVGGILTKTDVNYGTAQPTITLAGAAVIDDLEVMEGITLASTSAVIPSGSYLMMGSKSTLDVTSLLMRNGSGIQVNGFFTNNSAITAQFFTGKVANEIPTADDGFNNAVFRSAVDTNHSVSGFSIYVDRVQYSDVDGEGKPIVKFDQRVYVSGDLKVVKNDFTAIAGETPTIAVSATAVGGAGMAAQVFVAEDDDLAYYSKDGATAMFTSASNCELVIEGDLTGDLADAIRCVGAAYTAKVLTEEVSFVTSYKNMSAVLEVVDTVAINGVGANVLAANVGYGVGIYEIPADMTIAKGKSIAYGSGSDVIVVGADKTITINEGGLFNANALKTLNGKIVVENGGSITNIGLAKYQVVSTDAAGDKTYAGLAVVLAEAQAGDEIQFTGDNTGNRIKTVSIPAGVTLKVSGTLLAAQFIVAEGAEVKMVSSGTIDLAAYSTTVPSISVAGKMDVSNTGALVFDGTSDKSSVTSTGMLVIPTGYDFGKAKVVGATYVDAHGNTVLTNLEDAIESGATAITIPKSYTTTDDIVLEDGATLTIAAGATAKISSIDAEGATIVANGALSGTVVGVSGVEGATSVVELELDGFKGTISNTYFTNAEDKTEYVFQTNSAITGLKSMELSSGKLVLNHNIGGADAEASTILIGAGATLLVAEDVTIDDKFYGVALAGTVTVAEGKTLTVNSDLAITGDVVAEGTIAAGDVVLYGTLSVKDDVTVNNLEFEGSVTIATGKKLTVNECVIVGEPGVGAAPAISGKITLGANAYAVVYPGFFDVDDFANEDGAVDFDVNGITYVTAIYKGAAKAKDVLKATDFTALSDYYVVGITDITKWYDENGQHPGAEATLNTYKNKGLYYFAGLVSIDVKTSWDTGMSLYIDNVRVTESPVSLDVGTHTVMVKVNPGYKYADGTTATITFNGKAITGLLAFEITSDMAGTEPVLSATGDIVIDEQPIPEQKEKDDTMMIILLAILVIMIAILVVVVILRMMRS